MPMPFIALDSICPTCGAQPHEECNLKIGNALFDYHFERWKTARDHGSIPSLINPPPTQAPPKL